MTQAEKKELKEKKVARALELFKENPKMPVSELKTALQGEFGSALDGSLMYRLKNGPKKSAKKVKVEVEEATPAMKLKNLGQELFRSPQAAKIINKLIQGDVKAVSVDFITQKMKVRRIIDEEIDLS